MVGPDEDGREVECGLVGDGEFVGSCGQAAPLLEAVDAPFDGVALLVCLAVEAGRSAAESASPQAVTELVGRLRDDCTDAPASQVAADGAGGVRAVGPNGQGSGLGPAGAGAGHADAGHHRFEGGCIACLACGDGEGEGSCPAVCGQVDFGAQSAA